MRWFKFFDALGRGEKRAIRWLLLWIAIVVTLALVLNLAR